MTPRTDMVWFDVDDSDRKYGRSCWPTAIRAIQWRARLDDMIGVVMVKDLLAKRIANEPIDLEALAQQPLTCRKACRL